MARRELLSKCMALGVLTSTANLLPSALAAAWQEKEKSRLAPTPAAELGPFYKRLAPSNSAMRAPGDPGMPLVVTGQVFSSRGELIPSAIVEIWQTNHEGLYDLEWVSLSHQVDDSRRRQVRIFLRDAGALSCPSVPAHPLRRYRSGLSSARHSALFCDGSGVRRRSRQKFRARPSDKQPRIGATGDARGRPERHSGSGEV